MKKFLIPALLALLLFSITGCRANNIDRRFTFTAEVLEFDPVFALRNENAMLFVYSITPVFGHDSGIRYFITRNDTVTVLDANGEEISYSDIPPGTVVEIRYHGIVVESYPGLIPGAVSIRVIE